MNACAKGTIGAALMVVVFAISVAAAPPRLRPNIEVDHGQVTLGDLFENAGAVADVAVMAAPAPGERTELTIAQVFDLANRHGLGWRPVVPFTHVSIGRAWRYLNDREIAENLKDALREAGAGGTLTLDLPTRALEIKVARGALADVTFEAVSYEPETSRFQVTLVVRAAGTRVQRYNMVGRAFATLEIPVLRSRLRGEDVIRNDDIEWVERRTNKLPRAVITDAADLIGKSLTRAVAPGKPLKSGDVGAPTMVIRGAMVAMHYLAPNLHLVATGRAEESGARGEVIAVQNSHSRITIDAVVTGANRVEVRTPRQFAAQ
ncbi:MAG: flagellar basal body P-ring formation chaperone FlgA [Alphaproteobacteria bacterium]|nr:flagellar basal body P-ring formation chaperone FlgA [Alphaproteobacteria bacterium]